MRKRLLSLGKLAAAGCLLLGTGLAVEAQSNFVLHTFATGAYSASAAANTNFDGINPNGWLTWSGTKFYGTAQNGGTNGSGTLYSLATNGAFSLLYTFPKDSNATGNAFGSIPNGGLVLSGTNLYGTAQYGGVNDNGVIFSIVTNGTGIKLLHTNSALINTNFLGFYTNADGVNPMAGLVMSGKFLYGTAQNGGFGANGVVFSLSNTTYKVLHHFTAGNYDGFGTFTNGDGANPSCQLLLVGTNLYGTTYYGGTNGLGTVFVVSTNGSSFSVIRHFDDADSNGDHGANPSSGLVFSGGMLYGMGGSTVYALSTNGANFTNLWPFGVNLDNPPAISGLTASNGTLYGAATQAGAYGLGQIFALTTNGVTFADFHDFTPFPTGYPAPPPTNSDGYNPQGGLVLLNNLLYGAAFRGGTNAVNFNRESSGVIFQASPPPAWASSQLSGTNFVLGFQTFDGLSYTVQQNTNLTGTNWIRYTNIMGNSAIRQFTLPTTNSQLYFRVLQP